MNDATQLQEQIEAAALAARRSGQFIDIDFMLPSILIHRGPDDEFYFQEHEAQEQLDHYRPIAEMTHANLKDVLLWSAQGW